MAVVKINLSCELSEAVKVQYLHGNLFSQDNQANEINVAVFEDDEPVELAGTVTANVIRPDGGTVAVIGMILWGIVTLTLPKRSIPFSLMLSVMGTLLFIISSQPYAAAFGFLLLGIKAFLLIQKQ